MGKEIADCLQLKCNSEWSSKRGEGGVDVKGR